MNNASLGQVNRTAADIYEEFFVPALFQEPAGRVANAAHLAPGQAVLDVACGTGVLAREAARRIAPGGSVTGLDRNEGMLAVARRMAPGIDWRLGRAEQLPFNDGTYDAVVSQFGLMFFEDRRAAISEMWRVLRPEGRCTVAVFDGLEKSPGYAAMVALLQRLFGDAIANELRAPFALGDSGLLSGIFIDAGVHGAAFQSSDVVARFPSIDAWVHTEIKGWTLADRLDDAQFEKLRVSAHEALSAYVLADGTVSFPCPALIASAIKPS